mmetsp:Transcript_21129/g.30280  ORF Transcript_21129/g.30280 Transcript_21129/m.30280 type:complete len:152 (-) Transcript_21129:532-987(-)
MHSPLCTTHQHEVTIKKYYCSLLRHFAREGILDGFLVGLREGFLEGLLEGIFEGLGEGFLEGLREGFLEGLVEEGLVGELDGEMEGLEVAEEEVVFAVGTADTDSEPWNCEWRGEHCPAARDTVSETVCPSTEVSDTDTRDKSAPLGCATK